MFRSRHTKRERGASLVEFALLAPVLFALLLGMITGGLALATKNSMTNAVREGGRLGATLPGVADWDAWAADVKDRVVELAGGDLEADEVCVEMVSIDSSGDSTEGSWPASGCDLPMAMPTTPSSAPDGSCLVKVWAQRSATLNALAFSRSLTLEAKAVGQYERSECP